MSYPKSGIRCRIHATGGVTLHNRTTSAGGLDMTERNASRPLAMAIAGLLALGGYASQTLADDKSDQELRDQLKALQKQVEELTKKVNGPGSGSSQAPKTDVDQSPSPSRAVNAKEAESAPKLPGPQPITWNGI